MALRKNRSYLEPNDLPLGDINKGISLSEIIKKTKYDDVSEGEKKDIIVVKEAFSLLDPKRKKIGVFTRSEKDHGTKIGQCSTLLCGNFDNRICTVSQEGDIIYDVNVRLHEHIKEISGLFSTAKQKRLPALFFHDKNKNKRYLFMLFELICDSRQLPLCYHLDDRKGDLFIGMRDIEEVSNGVKRFNKSQFEIDNALVAILKSKAKPFGGRFSFAEKLVEAKLASFTLIKFQLFGV